MMLKEIIAAIKRQRDDHHCFILDSSQTRALVYWLEALEEGDGASIGFAALDLLGTLPSEREESA